MCVRVCACCALPVGAAAICIRGGNGGNLFGSVQ